ncbi:hypothetical protein HPB49_020398 [Dermacentor silvarum]|uniref:Uncharacterized protein n=1 Tax=Dermacentor silvarum TaxID=543639 RepID=A0ACB8DR43_DERSI|nr:hypothetical protein HPB49_020398 [Dermacentor silvarum]
MDSTDAPSLLDRGDNRSSRADSTTANRSPLEREGNLSNVGSDQAPISAHRGACLLDTGNKQGGEQCHLADGDCCDEEGTDDHEWCAPNEHSRNLGQKREQDSRVSPKDTEFDDVNDALPEVFDQDHQDNYLSVANQEDAAVELSSLGEEDLEPRSGLAAMPLAIPIIYRPLERSPNFWQADYSKVRRDLVRCAGCKLPSQKVLKSGFLSIIAPNPDAGRKLLKLNVIADIAVDPRLPTWYIKNVGKISGVPFRYTDRQLLDCFSEAGVIHVRRQITFLKDKDGTLSTTPEDCIILTFSPDIELPDTIALGFDVFRVHTYCAAPLQCYRCLRFGHTAYQCNAPRRCKLCTGPHIYKECKSQSVPLCANCGGEHAATFTGCPERRRIAMSRRFMPRYYVEWEEVSNRRPTSSRRHRDKERRGSSSDDTEGRCYRDKRERHRNERRSPSEERGSSSEGAGKSGDENRTSREPGSPGNESRTPRHDDGAPSRSEDEELRAWESEDMTDDNDAAETPTRRNVSPPRERRRPLSVLKFPRVTRDSRRRFKHGYHRYLHKLVKHGVPVFQRPSDD